MLVTKGEIKRGRYRRVDCIALFTFTVHIALVFIGVCYLLHDLVNKHRH